MRRIKPVSAVLDRELVHPRAVRRKNAYSRVFTALHESSHAAVGFSFTDWGAIFLPFDNPLNGYARCCGRTFDEDVMTHWAGYAIDRVLFGHSLFAQGDFYRGFQMLVKEYNHAGAATKAGELMADVEQIVIKLLPAIQSLAAEAVPQTMLFGNAFRYAAHRAGLESGTLRKLIRPKAAKKAAASLAQFAQTPEQLRRDLGFDALDAAHNALEAAWCPGDAMWLRVPDCECGCGVTLLSEADVCAALIDGWSPRLRVPAKYPYFFWHPGFFDKALLTG